MIDRDI